MVSFSSGSESRDRIRRADLLRNIVPYRRGGVGERHFLTYIIWTSDDRAHEKEHLYWLLDLQTGAGVCDNASLITEYTGLGVG